MKVIIIVIDYRMDSRTREVFEKDIAVSTARERDIIQRYKKIYESKYGKELVIEENGCDNSGDYLDDSEVTTKADFLLNGKPVEVKANNNKLVKFRLKKGQLESYIRQNAAIIWVNGYKSNDPTYTIVKVSVLESIYKSRKPIEFAGWGGKLCYEVYAKEFIWNAF